jgi:hypothetical protein
LDLSFFEKYLIEILMGLLQAIISYFQIIFFKNGYAIAIPFLATASGRNDDLQSSLFKWPTA